MSGYVKLMSDILESSVWVGTPAHIKLAWITILAKADARGAVTTPVPGLAKAAEVTQEQMREALDLFMRPDPNSRSTEHEGRRIEKLVDGPFAGFKVLNYEKYRAKDCTSAERSRRFRDNRNANATDCNGEGQSATPSNGEQRYRTQAEAEAEAEADLNPPVVPPFGGDALQLTNPDTEPKKRRGRAKRPMAKRPADWAPNSNHKSFSAENGIDIERESAKFCDFHDAKGNLYADWDAAFRTWLRNAVEFSKRDSANQQPAEDPNMKKLRELAQATVKAERARRTAAWDGSQKS